MASRQMQNHKCGYNSPRLRLQNKTLQNEMVPRVHFYRVLGIDEPKEAADVLAQLPEFRIEGLLDLIGQEKGNLLNSFLNRLARIDSKHWQRNSHRAQRTLLFLLISSLPWLVALSLAAEQFQVNSHTPEAQLSPEVAMAPGGAFVVVWDSRASDHGGTDTSRSSIRGQRFAVDGNPAGAEFQVNTGTMGYQTSPAVDMTDEGYVAIWLSPRSGASDIESITADLEIRGQRFLADGTHIGDEFRAHAGNALDPKDAIVRVAPDGRYLIAWSEADAVGGRIVQGRFFSPEGVGSNDFLISQQDNILSTARKPAVAHLESNGPTPEAALVAVWQCSDCDSSDSHGIRGQRFTVDGSKIGDVFPINGTVEGDQVAPSVTSGAEGNFFTVWATDGSRPQVWGRLFAPSGAPLTDDFLIAETPTLKPQVETLYDNEGVPNRFVVAWWNKLAGGPGDPDLFHRYFALDGTPLGEAIRINDLDGATEFAPVLSAGIDNTFVVAWHSIGSVDSDDSSSSIQARRLGTLEVQVLVDDGETFVAEEISELQYTIEVINLGEPLTDAHLADTFPSALTCNWSSLATGGATGNSAMGSGHLDETLSLPTNSSVIYNLTCAIASQAAGQLVSRATLLADNSAIIGVDDDTVLETKADLQIVKEDGVECVVPGRKLGYEIVAFNAGPTDAPETTLTDDLPDALQNCEWECEDADGPCDNPSGVGDIFETLSMPVGRQITYRLACNVDPLATTLSNTVRIDSTGIDPFPGNSEAIHATELTDTNVDLEVLFTGTEDPVPGEFFCFALVATNRSGDLVNPAELRYVIPDGLTCAWATLESGDVQGNRNCGTTRPVSCQVPADPSSDPFEPCTDPALADDLILPGDTTVGYALECRVDPELVGTITHNISIESEIRDCDPDDNVLEVNSLLTPEADLYVDLEVNPLTAVPGDGIPVQYALTVGNAGPSTAAGARLVDDFPAALSCNWQSVASDEGVVGNSNGSGDLDDLLLLPPGSSVDYEVSCTLDPAATMSLENTATVTLPAEIDEDPNDTNNSASVTTALTPGADLAITLSDDVEGLAEGQHFTYTIQVSNHGPSSVSGAQVRDLFPPILSCSWTCSGSEGTSCTSGPVSADIEDSVDLPVDSSITYLAQCVVGPVSAEVVNEATVTIPSGISELEESNNRATDTNGPPVQFPFIERFSNENSLNPTWVRSDSTDLVAGWLQLTQPVPDQQGWAIIDAPFSSFRDILVEFDYSIPEGSQGQGLSVFLFDGVRLASETLGGPGSCLGYSTGPLCDGASGVIDAYLGIGLDLQGDFSDPGTGSSGGPGNQPNHVVVRGSGDGVAGYPFLAGVEVPNGIVGQNKMRLWFVDQTLTLEIETDRVSQTLIHRLDLMSTGDPTPLPETLKIGFAATTGAEVGTFEIDNLIISVPQVTPGESVWQATETMASARSQHSLTLLLDGKILALGSNSLETEIFDPATGSWSPAGNLVSAISEGHTATLLATGQVLAVSGASAQIYDPSINTWSITASPNHSRVYHSATLLPSGKVLVAGGHAPGNPSDAIAMVEIFDPWGPAVPSWTDLNPLIEPRYHHTATLKEDGAVWITGGEIQVGSETLVRTTVESVDPDRIPTVSVPINGLPSGFTRHTANRLSDDTILLAGGESFEPVRLVSDQIQVCGNSANEPQPLPRRNQRGALLPSGDVLVAGGFEAPEFNTATSQADTFRRSDNPAECAWESTTLSTSRASHAMTLLPSGDVLVSGGRLTLEGAALGSGEIFRPGNGHWLTEANFEASRSRWQGHTTTLLPSGEVLVVGGQANPSGTLRPADLYDPTTQVWTTLEDPAAFRRGHTATLLTAESDDDISGRVLILGGEATDESLSSAVIFDVATRSWSAQCEMPEARNQHTATLLADGRILVVGGENAGNLLDGTIIIDATTTTQSGTPTCIASATSSPLSPRIGHTATLLPSSQVLVVGGHDGAGTVVTTTEIYDPVTDQWTLITPPGDPRSLHTATLLPSGQVLMAGGFLQSGGLGVGTELFDPQTESWLQGRPLSTGRFRHSATLLTSGHVLVTGGEQEAVGRPQSSEIYDPAAGAWRPAGRLPYLTLFDHTATLLASGDVLLLSLDAQRYDPLGIPEERIRPEITQPPLAWLRYDQSFSLEGTGFIGDSEASDGVRGNSAGYPLVRLHSLENDRQAWLVPNPQQHFGVDDPDDELPTTTLTFGDSDGILPSYYDLPPVFDPGWHRLTVIAAGVPSASALVHVQCSLEVGQPTIISLIDAAGNLIEDLGTSIPVGGQVRFAIETRGGRQIQWQKNTGDSINPQWVDIEGARGSTYLTPPLSGLESGTQYRVRISSGCAEEISPEVTFFVDDQDAPNVRVVSPNGGDYWALSTALETNLERVIFEVNDPTTWPCEMTAELIYSLDEGESWQVAPPTGSAPDRMLPRTLGEGERCELAAAVESGTVSYEVPLEGNPPSGQTGSLYKVRLTATDHGGNVSVVESTHPFFIVPPNDQSVRTLILFHPQRLGVSCASDSEPEVCRKLRELAGHPQVNGLLVDLEVGDDTTPLRQLYQAWDDAAPTETNRAANAVLFGEGGIQDRLLELVRIFTSVDSILLVGDDTVIPFARVPDRSGLLGEEAYTDINDAPVDLSADGSTVGRAIDAGLFLTDDPLAALLAPIDQPSDLDQDGLLVIPDVAVGRLVESPEDIVASIANFQRTNGLLDLSQRQHKVLVTGYDFLTDSANIVAEKWRCSFDPQEDPTQCAPSQGSVDASLLSQSFSEGDLQAALCGNGGEPYGLINLNGHANHFLEGVPGEEHYDITGLEAETLGNDFVCDGQPLDLQGAVVYAVGCHGGLPVPQSAPAADNPLDLPQTLLRRGALTYIANTGYGWGLKEGIGYSERLIEIFTDQLRVGGEDGQDLNVGQAVLDAKLRYYQESRGLDDYGLKTLMQWTTFGFPMARLRTGIVPPEGLASIPSLPRPIRGPAPEVNELPEVEDRGSLSVHRQFSGQGIEDGEGDELPPFMTLARVGFVFSGNSYTKRQGDGTRVPPEIEGCPSEAGCYYTLNELGERGTGDSDRPIQPFLVYDSRVPGTSQHGVLWLGGGYQEEGNWLPIFAELISNAEETGENHGIAPQMVVGDPIETPFPSPSTQGTCSPVDRELNTVVIPTGDVRQGPGGPGAGSVDPSKYDIQRIYQNLNLEIFYFNDLNEPLNNCDRDGPEGLETNSGPFDGAYHQVEGSTITWGAQVHDVSDVWRVVVVYDARETLDADGGNWQNLELTYDTNAEMWLGNASFANGQQVTYILQAVDRKGNVSRLRFQQSDGSEAEGTTQTTDSGVDPRYLEAVPLEVGGITDLALTLETGTGPINPNDSLELNIHISHQAGDPATAVSVFLEPFPGSSVTAVAPQCVSPSGAETILCQLGQLPVGGSQDLVFLLEVPSQLGLYEARAWVESAESDPAIENNESQVTITVVESDTPPQVTSVRSAAAVPGGLFESEVPSIDEKSVDVALTQLRLVFDEEVNGANQATSFLLVEAGVDGVWQTKSIQTGVEGDDIAIPIGGVTYEASELTTVLDLVRARPLQPGRYRLLAGFGIFDEAMQFLDGNGDGIGGDDFRHQWSVIRSHRLINPNFDRDLNDWIPVTMGNGLVEFDGLDSESVRSSGSARLTIGSGLPGTSALAQCVAAEPGERLAFGGRIHYSPDAPWTYLKLQAEAWSSSTCDASLLDQEVTDVLALNLDRGDTWTTLPLEWIVIPEGGHSLLLTFLAQADGSDSTALRVDNVEAFIMLFSDGFETGDLRRWSGSFGGSQ